MKILLIAEDEAIVRFYVSMQLQTLEGVTVREAKDGQTAIEEFDRQRPDLIITDIMMTPVDGCELIQYIRSKDKTIPIVVMTGLTDYCPRRQPDCTCHAIQGIIRKPVDINILHSVVKANLL